MTDTFGFDEFIDALGDLEEGFNREATKLLEETGDLAVAETKARTPVDTGTLRRSFVRGDVKNLEVELGSPIHYAQFVEEGTRKQGAKHMLRDGVTVAQKHFESESEKLFNKVLGGFKL